MLHSAAALEYNVSFLACRVREAVRFGLLMWNSFRCRSVDGLKTLRTQTPRAQWPLLYIFPCGGMRFSMLPCFDWAVTGPRALSSCIHPLALLPHAFLSRRHSSVSPSVCFLYRAPPFLYDASWSQGYHPVWCLSFIAFCKLGCFDFLYIFSCSFCCTSCLLIMQLSHQVRVFCYYVRSSWCVPR